MREREREREGGREREREREGGRSLTRRPTKTSRRRLNTGWAGFSSYAPVELLFPLFFCKGTNTSRYPSAQKTYGAAYRLQEREIGFAFELYMPIAS
jgi:hypothetical protein